MEFSGQRTCTEVEGGDEYDAFTLFFPEEIYSLVAKETKTYAEKIINNIQIRPLQKNSRKHSWNPVTECEIKAFIAMEIGMGLIRKPTIES